MFARRYLILLCVTICMHQVQCADKYTDENRPYEFGFTIDGEQHRHEKKDENGIIMGEFGFITADGVYHVTVYATDENGGFKILSMKNIRVKPYPNAKTGPERGRSLEYSSSPQIPSKSSLPEQNNKQLKEPQKPGVASPAKSCSHCSIPTTTTTTTEAPYIPNNNLQQIPAISQEPVIPPKYNQYQDNYSQKDVRNQVYLQQKQQQQQEQQQQRQQQERLRQEQLQEGQLQQGKQQQGQLQLEQLQQGQLQQGQLQQGQLQQGQLQQGQLQQGQLQQGQLQQGQLQQGQLQQGQQQLDKFDHEQSYQQSEIGSAQNYEQSGKNSKENYPQQTQEELKTPNYQIQQQQQLEEEQLKQQNQQQEQQQYSYHQLGIGSVQNYPQSGQNAKKNFSQQSYTQTQQSGLGSPNYQIGSSQDQTYPENKEQTNYPGSTSGQTYPHSVTSDNQGQKLQPETNRNPKSYDEQSRHGQIPEQRFNALSSPPYSSVPQENLPPKKPQLISAQMQIVDKNTDIHYKRPGEKEGLPKGLSKDDMSQLLYTFNYTVGFHGHFEEGYKNGAKVGYYYVTGRNGVRTRVDYVADENGFRPKITQEVLDLLSDDVPKPDTEKDAKYGLKGYEFKWLYYPIDTK